MEAWRLWKLVDRGPQWEDRKVEGLWAGLWVLQWEDREVEGL